MLGDFLTTVDVLSSRMGKERWGFGIQYSFKSDFMYTMGGNDNNYAVIKKCYVLDLINQKWKRMPDLNKEQYGPGTFIDSKKEYLYSLG